MNNLYNVYCDESCHLEGDGINDMILGAVWCPQNKIRKINSDIKDIKLRYNVMPNSELKWTKVGPVKEELYTEIINYFFDCKDLHFRCLIIPDKDQLDHKRFNQTHDEWYYKMYFDMLKVIFNPEDRYEVFIDIKDTNSFRRACKLREVCSNSIYDFSGKVIQKIQPIRSNEVQIMQIVDILIGAVGYQNRVFPKGFIKSSTKLKLIQLIKEKTNYKLTKSTLYKEDKFNILVWDAR